MTYKQLSFLGSFLIIASSVSVANSQVCPKLNNIYFEPQTKFDIYQDEYYTYFDDFIDFIDSYQKHYFTTTEFWYRYNIFSANMEKINNHNLNGTHTYKLGVNKFADMSHREFSSIYLTNKYTDFGPHIIHQHETDFSLDDLPDSIDWRAMSLVTDVKDQAQCGSCWAFSAVGAIEGQHAKATGNLVSLSEQDLVDCINSTQYDCFGCEGGFPYNAMQYVIDNKGIDGESSYPYKALDGTCVYNASNSLANISKVLNVTQGSMDSLYHAIATVGPVSIAIDAEDNFQFYKSGVFSDTACSSDELDHAVLAVGYGTMGNSSYLIVKNSWGKDWGMDGYIYMSTNIPNMCGVAQMASYPQV
jgi:cathepsin L